MSSVTATINVNINAANAAAQLAALQGKVATMNKGMLAATAGGVMAQEKAIRRMGNVLNGSGMFTTGIRNVHTQLGRMHQEFDKGSTTMSKYRQNSKMWSNDHSRINALAADRVRMLQSQYVALGKEMNGVQKTMQIKPDRMMREFGADAMYATQQQMLFRRNLQMGATSLVNWGKNTQWAGRQMMVGMGIPIALVSAGAIKSFNEIEQASIAFKRVYGDTTTSVAEKSQMLTTVQKGVAKEMMKYGIATADTLDVAAKAAATGAQGADLIAATRETMRLATLGNMDYQKALESTIAMQTAFGISSEDMGQKTDFLNAVENQTILSMEDMALAVPRVAPVIKGLGGGIEELAIMMTALRQGGVTAEQGANALKSGLASMINPTSTATEALGNMGINLDKIVKANKGDIIGTVQGLGKALEGLSKFKRQQALESLFGKYQYARMGALLKNINSKAVKETMKMAKAPAEDLAKMSAQELSQISDSPMIKLRKSIEELKAAAAPLGAVLSDIGAKVIGFVTPMVEFFSNNSWARGFLIGVAGIAAVAGTLTMIVGVLANFAGSMVKAGMAVKNFFRIMTGRGSLAYVASEELEATAAANSLASASERAASAHMAQANAAKLLVSELNALAAAQLKAAGTTSAVGTRPVATAPKATAPGVIPAGNQASYTAAVGRAERNHVGGARPLTPAELAFWQQNVKGNGRAAQLLANVQPGQQVMGKNARTLIASKDFNNETKTGVTGSRWASIMGAQGANMTTSSLMETMARNLGITNPAEQAAWARSEEGSRFRTAMFNAAVGDMDRLGNQLVSDTGDKTKGVQSIQHVVDSAMEREVKSFSPAIQEAFAKTGQVGEVAVRDAQGKIGAWYSLQNPDIHGANYAAGTKSKGVGVPQIIDRFGGAETYGQMAIPNVDKDTPTIVTDKDGKPVARVVPENTTAGKKISASSVYVPAGTKGVTYGPSQLQQVAKTQPKTPVPAPTQTKIAQPRQFTGMGLMGAGMLASTAMMGMQAAGKEVPAAAEFAAQGLTGVGMAAMMFPGSMTKLSSGVSKVAGLFGPYGKAIAVATTIAVSGALMYKKMTNDARVRGQELAKAFASTADFAKAAGEQFQKTSLVEERVAKQRNTTAEKMSQGQQFLDSEFGKTAIDGFNLVAERFGVTVASQQFADKIASAMVEGTMSAADTRGVLAAMPDQTMARLVESQLKVITGGKLSRIEKDPTSAALSILQRTSGDIQRLDRFLSERTAAARAYTDARGSKALSQRDYSGRTQRVDDAEIQRRKAEAERLGVGNTSARLLMEENSALVGQVWSESMKTAYRNRIAAEVRLQQQRQELKGLDPKSQEAITLQKSINQGVRNLDKYDTANAQMVDNILNGYERLSSNENARKGMYGAVYDDVGKNFGAVGKLALEAVQGAGVTPRMEFEVALRMAQGELDPSVIFAAATGQQSLDIPMVLDITNTVGAEKASKFFAEILALPKGKAAAAMSGVSSMFKKVAQDAGLGEKATQKLQAAILGTKAAGGRGTGVKAPKDQVQNIRQRTVKDKDADKKPKDQTFTVRAKADVGGAKKDVIDLGATVDATAKKKINIRAQANVGGVEQKIKGLGAAANVESKVTVTQEINRVLGKDESKTPAETLQQIINRIIGADMSTIPPIPQIQFITRSVLPGSWQVPPPPVTQIVNRKVVGESAEGGLFNYANGGTHNGDGKVTGPGGPTDDKVNARLSNGEFVIRAKSVDKYGTAFLDAVNRGAYEKQAHAKGTKPVPGATLPPKESDAKGRQADFNKDWKQMMWEMENFLNEVKAMPKIIKQGTQMLPKKMREFGDEFARYLMETYDPKQINKILNKTKKGKFTAQGKKVSRQWVQEQKITEKFDKKQALREEIESQKASLKAAKARDQLLRSRDAYGKETPEATAIGNMSDEQMQMYQGFKTQKKKNAFVKRLVGVEQINKAQADYAEKFSRRKEVEKQYGSATGKDIAGLTGSGFNLEQLSQWANDLGMSIQDLAEQFADGNLPTNIDQLAAQAKQAGKALEVLAMTKTERQSEQISNYEQKMANLQKQAEAKGRANVIGKNLGGQIGSGNSQGELEAQMALVDAQNAIKQAQIDDINEKYDKQLETIDLISQHQQAIANLERGRLTVAGALSTGDIAAAAAAAQEHRNNMAAFAQDQMRRQLENQQKAQTQVLQDQINEAAKLNRDIQNQITLAIAEANVEQAAAIAAEQAKADDIVLNTTYIADMNAELDNQNALLAAELTTLQNMVTAAQALQAALSNQPPPPAEYSVPSNSAGTGGGGTVGGGGGGFGKKKKKKHKAFGGFIPGIGNIDSVNTMLTPGEFVVNKAQAAKFGPTLRDINAGSFKGGAVNGGNVNIDSIIFQISGANLNERDIADIAVRKMQTLDAATIRGGRF